MSRFWDAKGDGRWDDEMVGKLHELMEYFNDEEVPIYIIAVPQYNEETTGVANMHTSPRGSGVAIAIFKVFDGLLAFPQMVKYMAENWRKVWDTAEEEDGYDLMTGAAPGRTREEGRHWVEHGSLFDRINAADIESVEDLMEAIKEALGQDDGYKGPDFDYNDPNLERLRAGIEEYLDEFEEEYL